MPLDGKIDFVIKSLVSHFRFSPVQLTGLFWDRQDYLGMVYWYDFMKEQQQAYPKARGVK